VLGRGGRREGLRGIVEREPAGHEVPDVDPARADDLEGPFDVAPHVHRAALQADLTVLDQGKRDRATVRRHPEDEDGSAALREIHREVDGRLDGDAVERHVGPLAERVA